MLLSGLEEKEAAEFLRLLAKRSKRATTSAGRRCKRAHDMNCGKRGHAYESRDFGGGAVRAYRAEYPPTDHQHLARHEGTAGAKQEDDRLGDFRRLGDAPERMGGPDLAAPRAGSGSASR